MRTWIVVGAVVLVGIVAFALPTRSQEATRIGAVIDVTALTAKLDALIKEVTALQKQNDELKKAVDDTNVRLALIARGVGVPDKDNRFLIRMPTRWEYSFVRRSLKLANQMGSQGWELVTAYESKDYLMFRRPLPPKAPNEDLGGREP